MKRTIFIAILMIFTLSATTFASNSNLKSAAPASTENKLSTEDMTSLKNRVAEINAMDKSSMTHAEKTALKEELTGIKEKVKKSDGYIFIGGGSLLLLIILLILIF